MLHPDATAFRYRSAQASKSCVRHRQHFRFLHLGVSLRVAVHFGNRQIRGVQEIAPLDPVPAAMSLVQRVRGDLQDQSNVPVLHLFFQRRVRRKYP